MKQSKQSEEAIGISMRIVESDQYPEARDCISHDWIKFLENTGYKFIFIPNNLKNLPLFLETYNLKGFIITGGEDIGIHPQRDKTEKKIIEYGLKENLPILGVCRGMQLINNYFGGGSRSVKNHVKKIHSIKITDSNFSKLFKKSSAFVNSYHTKGILSEDLGKNLKSWALNGDTIEGLTHKKMPIIGIMWHPERNKKIKTIDREIFKYLFDSR